MSKCNKCGVYVDTVGDICPLCKSKIKKNVTDSSYPKIINKLTGNFVRKLIRFIVVSISLIVLLINYLVTPDYKWAGFVVAALFSTYIVFRKIMDGRRNVLKLMFTLNFLLMILSIFWDYYIGYRGWSLNFVLPSLCICYGIFLVILRFVSYFAFRENSTYIYLNVFLEFLPVILLHFGKIDFKILALLSGVLGVINLLILVLFDGSKLKSDLEKKLHI